MVKRCTDKVLLAFDADGAGQKAVLRAVEMLLPLSMEIKVIRIPGGKDPDELFSHGGAEAVKAAVEAAVPWLTVLCDSLPGKFDFASPSGRARAAALVSDYLVLVESRVELEMYVRMAANTLSVSEAAVWMELKNAEKRRRRGEAFAPPEAAQENAVPEERPEADPALVTLFGLALSGEDAARHIAEAVPPEELPAADPVAQAVNIVINAALNGEFNEINPALAALLREQEIPEISRTMLSPPQYDPEDLLQAIDETAAELHRRSARRKLESITDALRRAATSEEKIKLLAEIQKLNGPATTGENQ